MRPLDIPPGRALLLIGLGVIAMIGSLWLPNHTLNQGEILHLAPLYRFPWQGPLNLQIAMGAPHLANPQLGAFYLPTWLLAADFHRFLPLYLFMHYALGGFGVYLWARHRGHLSLAACLGGLVYALSGPAQSLSIRPDSLAGFATLPYLLWGLSPSGWSDKVKAWLPFLPPLAIAATTLGGSLDALPTAALASLWVVLNGNGLRTLQTVKNAWAALLPWMRHWLLGLGLASCLLIPFFSLLSHTIWAQPFALSGKVWHALSPQDLPAALLALNGPSALGPVQSDILFHGLSHMGASTFGSLYLGLFPCLLIIIGLVAPISVRDRIFICVGLGLFTLLALGPHTHFYASFLGHLPPFNRLRSPENFILGALAFFSLGVSGGLHALLTGLNAKAHQRARVIPLVCGLLALILVPTLLWHLHRFPDIWQLRTSGRWTSPHFNLLFTAMAGALCLLGHRMGGKWLPALLCLFIAGDLIVSNRGIHPTIPLEQTQAPAALMDALGNGHPPRVWDDAYEQMGAQAPGAIAGITHRPFRPNMGADTGLYYANGAHRLRTLANAHFLDGLGSLPTFERRYQVLRRLNIPYYLFWNAEQAKIIGQRLGLRLQNAAGPPPFILVDDRPQREMERFSCIKLAADLPSAFSPLSDPKLASCAIAHRSKHFQALPEALLLNGSPPPHNVSTHDTLDVLEARPDFIHAHYQRKTLGYVQISRAHLPGWQYRIDDGPWQNAHLINIWLTGAPLPRGDHHIIFRYRPKGLALGLCLSGLSLLLLIFWTRRQGRTVPRTVRT